MDCDKILPFLASDASNSLSNEDYFGLVHYYNVHC
jgi:hypothetical protein